MKKIIFATAVAMISFFSCSKAELENTSNPLPMPENTAVSAQGLDVTPKTNYVVVGESVSLTATLKPEDAQAGTIAWKSSNEAVATVDANGHVTTLAVGVAHITASVDGVSASALVNVFAERVPATEIQLSKTEVSLLVGRAANIKSALLPENTTDARKLEWTSSDEKVAVVSYGYIQAVGMGEATITARQDDLTATVKVTVADKIKLVDRAEAWTVTDTPKWDKNWSGKITGSHVTVSVAGFDGEYACFGIVEAAKFEGVEAVSNAIYEQVTEKQDAGQSPEGLFRKGEAFSADYSDKGEAVAYLLAYDSEFEFTGEYVVYNFTAREPDPVHATGIEFQGQSGWDYAAISSLTLKEGKSTRLQLKLLPEDCTDTGSITLAPKDPSMMKVEAYYPQWYDNQFTVTALAEGTTKLVATFNDVVSELDVTITGTNITLTDHSATWAATKEVTEQWGYTVVKITVTACDASSFYATATDDKPEGATLKSTLAAMADAASSYDIQSQVPATFQSWGGPDGRYIVILGYASGDFSGDYAIIDTEAGSGDNPGGGSEGTEGKMVAMSNNYFSVTWDDEYASLDELTMEGWVYGDSFTGNASGNDGLASMMGVEGVFLIRLQNGKPEVVCDKNADEKKVFSSTALADKEWHHIAATYSAGNKIILYVDGEEVGSTDAPNHKLSMNGVGDGWAGGGLADWHFFIGVSCQTSRDFDGSLAYLRCWDTVRSAAQIKDNMKVADPDDPGYSMMANWYFNEGSGNTITDHSINGYDITANSALSWIDGTLPF